MPNNSFIYQRRIYYSDTDAGGIVYHAHYLRFAEEARIEWLRAFGIDQACLVKEDCFFVVTRVNLTYHKPAILDDLLTVETRIIKTTGTRYFFLHKILRSEELIAQIELVSASVNSKGRPRPNPACLDKLRNRT